MRALYLPWDLALKDGERLLDDIKRWTEIDTVMFMDLFSAKVKKGKRQVAYLDSKVVLPPSTKFDVPVSRLNDEEFASMTGFMKEAKSRGLSVASIVAPLFVCGGHDSMATVDVTGRRLHVRAGTIFYGCPNNDAVFRYGRDFIRSLVDSWPGLGFLTLDHLEYPSNLFVSYPKADLRDLLVCFCGSCQEKATREGFDIKGAKEEVGSLLKLVSTRGARRVSLKSTQTVDVVNYLLRHPLLVEWLNFRMKSMTDYSKRMLEVSRYPGSTTKNDLKVGMYFQLPTLSNLVGTDYDSLAPMFDYACVKFPDYLPGSILPIVADAIAKGTKVVDRDELLSAMRRFLDIGPGPKKYRSLGGLKDVLLYSNATDNTMVDRQMARLADVSSRSKLLPHFWEHNGDIAALKRKMDAVRKHGMKDYTIWAFHDGLTTEKLRAVQGII
jgi:hypothetical protein